MAIRLWDHIIVGVLKLFPILNSDLVELVCLKDHRVVFRPFSQTCPNH
jgi:hypothetical protein